MLNKKHKKLKIIYVCICIYTHCEDINKYFFKIKLMCLIFMKIKIFDRFVQVQSCSNIYHLYSKI